MPVNPQCGNGRIDEFYDGDVDHDDAEFIGYVAVCPCGWESVAKPSKTQAKKAQQNHRYPPLKETA